MAILVDAGNSRIKWGWLKGGAVRVGDPFATDSVALPDQLRERWSVLSEPRVVYLSNVAGPEWERRFLGWVRREWHAEVRVVRSQPQAFGIVNAYQRPETLGVDRWVGLIGARVLFGLPFCLVDCGTAITVDLVDRSGRHRGGLIAPGPTLMKDMLMRRVPGIQDGLALPEGFWGRSTACGIDGGVRETAIGLIERAARQARITLDIEPVLVLTGGDAERLAAYLESACQLVPDLVLSGLAAIARSECSSALGG